LRLRAAVRDLAALSAISAVSTGKEPLAVATGLAEQLVGLLELDFAFVRLRDPDGAGAVEVTRGEAWKGFPNWLEAHLAVGPVSRREIVADVGGGSEPCRGFAIPIGFKGEGGIVATACGRSDFPTEMEQLLLSFAANQAATAFRNARLIQEREVHLAELAQEQAALRRVATLVAQDVPSEELFGAVVQELGTLLGADYTGMIRYESDPTFVTTMSTWAADGEHPPARSRSRTVPGDPTSMVAETGKPARVDDWVNVPGPIAEFVRRELQVKSSVGSPIVVKGTLWGALAVHSKSGPLPRDTESRLLSFTELVATAIANTDERAEVSRLAEEQAALRRVATLVATGLGPEAVFTAVASEVRTLLGADLSAVVRFEADGMATVMAGIGGPNAPGARVELSPGYVVWTVRETARAARFDTDDPADAELPEIVRSEHIRSGLASPIIVNGALWGAVTASSTDALMSADAESRIAQVAELMATAISNVEAREGMRTLAEEQAALRRVAELVARGASPGEVFGAVADEMAGLLTADHVVVCRYEPGADLTVLAHHGSTGQQVPPGTRINHEGGSVEGVVWRTARSARIESYEGARGTIPELARAAGVQVAVGAPIVVGGRLWGVVSAGWDWGQPPRVDTEERMAKFANLVATAIANAEAQGEVERLAEEQAALRRVATLVAQGAPPGHVLDAVASEMDHVLGSDGVTLGRYEPDDEVIVVAHSGSDPRRVPPGTRVSHRGENVTSLVRHSRRSARVEHREDAPGALAEIVRSLGVRASVGAPIVVDGRLWGVAIANWKGAESPPAETEERMARFAELLETAIANADGRDKLTASRARLVTEADDARRRVVRDLHDGAQQRLVHTIVTLKLAQRALQANDDRIEPLVAEALDHAQQGNAELRELAHGLLPAVLTQGGLQAGVNAIVSRVDLPVDVEIPAQRFPPEVEASAYFVVAEALTNVVKHSRATRAAVRVTVEDGVLRVEVRDDGIGGADPTGHGLVGLGDRVTAIGGHLVVESPGGGGTLLAAELPVSGS
jgi:GAF domain-containing protein